MWSKSWAVIGRDAVEAMTSQCILIHAMRNVNIADLEKKDEKKASAILYFYQPQLNDDEFSH